MTRIRWTSGDKSLKGDTGEKGEDGEKQTCGIKFRWYMECVINCVLRREESPEPPPQYTAPIYIGPDQSNGEEQYNSQKDAEAADSNSTIASSEDENPTRGNWSGKMDFLLSCLSYAVGLGNLWRFPYLCYRNGGGAFLIPYFFMLIFAGLPLFFMELSFGQFASEGVISIWKVCPLLQGIGWGMFLVSCFIGVYYNMVIAWTLFYLVASFNTDVPWRDCGNHWNTPSCYVHGFTGLKNCTMYNGTWFNHTCRYDLDHPELANHTFNFTEFRKAVKSPSEEYWNNFVLDISEGIHDLGGIRWQLALALLGAWSLVGVCLIRGIKSQGRVVYFTATFPYLVLCALFVRVITLKGSLGGIMYYLTPEWHRLLQAKVWGDAAVQIFFSLSPCWGGLITLASYNKFNNNCLRDSLVVSLGNCLTSFFAGFVIFGIIGIMAHELGLHINEVAAQGAGLAFVVYPDVVSKLPVSPLWAVLFFAMLVTLGLGTQFSVVTTVHTTLLDVFPRVLRVGRRPSFLMLLICCIGYLLGLTCTTRGGIYMLQLIDNYSATYSLLIIGLFECVGLSWVYGIDNFFADIKQMLGHNPHLWWKVMWKYVSPFLLTFIMIFTWIDYVPLKYDDYQYPRWADAMGWMMSMTSVVAIPIVMVYKICTTDHKGTVWEKVKFLAKPTAEWGPASERNRAVATIQHNLGQNIPLHSETVNEKTSEHSEQTKAEMERLVCAEDGTKCDVNVNSVTANGDSATAEC